MGTPKEGQRLKAIYKTLLAHFGHRQWWPADSPFEVMVGAILTQNTSWRNVEKALANLAEAGLTTPEALSQADDGILGRALKPSGYFNIKKKRLLALVDLVLTAGNGGLYPEILGWPLERLRPALLGVRGVGPETADSIVLYAAGQPSFVVDVYTRRILSRHGLAAGDEPYEDIRKWFMGLLPQEVLLYNEFHALIVAAGHNFCKPRPDCASCPLEGEPGRVVAGKARAEE